MTSMLAFMLFGAAFLAAAWTIADSVLPRLAQILELFGLRTAVPPLAMREPRVTARTASCRARPAHARARAVA